MRAHKLVYEALLRVAWNQFHGQVQAFSTDAVKCTITEAMYNATQLNEDLCESQLHRILELESVQFMITSV